MDDEFKHPIPLPASPLKGEELWVGVVLQRVVDHGLGSGSSAELNQALLLFLLVVSVLAVAARVYLVNWLGERAEEKGRNPYSIASCSEIRRHFLHSSPRLDHATN